MTTCINCIYWQGNRKIDPDYPLRKPDEEYREGVCVRIGATLDISIHAGWNGGTVDKICTPASFGCALGEEVK